MYTGNYTIHFIRYKHVNPVLKKIYIQRESWKSRWAKVAKSKNPGLTGIWIQTVDSLQLFCVICTVFQVRLFPWALSPSVLNAIHRAAAPCRVINGDMRTGDCGIYYPPPLPQQFCHVLRCALKNAVLIASKASFILMEKHVME